MNVWLRNLWEKLREAYWLPPALMAAGAAALAWALVQVDRAYVTDRWVGRAGWFWTGGPDRARELLSMAAAAVLGVAGVTFSINVVAMTLASSQFGPRVLHNFMRDRGNQVVLGTFIATFVYCLVVLRSIRGSDFGGFVPSVSVTVAVLLVLASLGALIYFIHHIARGISAETITAGIAADLHDAIERLFPQNLGRPGPGGGGGQPPAGLPEGFDEDASPICADDSGYVEAIDEAALMRLAVEHDLVLRLAARPGHFVIRGAPLARAAPAGRVSDGVRRGVNRAFVLGSRRTLTQDVEFALLQLVEVAVRSLSPGTNDPFTAVTCVDHIGAALAHLVRNDIPSPFRLDEGGRLRVVADPATFEGLCDAAFNEIRQYGKTSVAVSIRMLEVIGVLVGLARNDGQRAALLKHAGMIHREATGAQGEAHDRRDLDRRYREALERAGGAEPSRTP